MAKMIIIIYHLSFINCQTSQHHNTKVLKYLKVGYILNYGATCLQDNVLVVVVSQMSATTSFFTSHLSKIQPLYECHETAACLNALPYTGRQLSRPLLDWFYVMFFVHNNTRSDTKKMRLYLVFLPFFHPIRMRPSWMLILIGSNKEEILNIVSFLLCQIS